MSPRSEMCPSEHKGGWLSVHSLKREWGAPGVSVVELLSSLSREGPGAWLGSAEDHGKSHKLPLSCSPQ